MEADLLVFPMLDAPARPGRGDHDQDLTSVGLDLGRGWPDLSNGGAKVEGERARGGRRKEENGRMGKERYMNRASCASRPLAASASIHAKSSPWRASSRQGLPAKMTKPGRHTGDSVLEADLLVFPMLVAAARPKRGNHDPNPTLGGPDLDRG
jgi:hypothetical protein